ncbi:MAG TPA: hypothetical protein PK299_05795 [Anaerolineales bacterium]|nr:hypothetical protein [Anaerolineales bacterium]
MAQRKQSIGLDSIFRKTEADAGASQTSSFAKPFASGAAEADSATSAADEELKQPAANPAPVWKTEQALADEIVSSEPPPPSASVRRRPGRPPGSGAKTGGVQNGYVRPKLSGATPSANDTVQLVRQIDLDEGRFRSVGVGLRDSEVDAIDLIAESAGVTRNAILRYAIRYFLRQYQGGKAQLAIEEQRTVSLLLP